MTFGDSDGFMKGVTSSMDEGRKVFDRAIDAGVNLIDTANVYSNGQSEELTGKWIAGKRDRVLLATKCRFPVGMHKPGPHEHGLSRKHVMEACEASLKRLGTDVIDLYYAHKDDEAVAQEETARAFGTLVAAGKVRVLGASNVSAARLDSAMATSAALGLPRYEVMQPLCNLMERGIEAELVPACVKHGMAVAPYSALASGFLSGKYRSEADLGKSVRGPRSAAKYLTPKGHAVLAALDAVAARAGATPAQVAIAWLIAKPGITAALASATSLEQLAELVRAASLSLDAEAMTVLDAASA